MKPTYEELLDALTGMVNQHCWEDIALTHFFISANQHALEILERACVIRYIGQERYVYILEAEPTDLITRLKFGAEAGELARRRRELALLGLNATEGRAEV